MLMLSTLALAACGGGEETPCTHESVGDDGKCTECGEQVNDPTPPPADGELVLVKDGKAKFNFVIGVTNADAAMDINGFIAEFNELVDEGAETVADIAGTVSDVEIIFGPVKSRGDAFKVDEHYLGPKGYEIKMIGTKIAIFAGAPENYEDAVKWLKKEIFGISKSTKSITDLTVTAESVAKLVESTYNVDSVKIAGNDLDDYVIVVDDPLKISAEGDREKTLSKLASAAQAAFYANFGAWCEIVTAKNYDGESLAIILKVTDNDGVSDGYCATVTDGGNFVIESMYPDKMYGLAYDILITDIAATNKKTLKINKGVYEEKNLRDIYYSAFGATDNGKDDDDFAAIKACHEYANTWGHTVHADAGATYYIGHETNGESIPVMTDTFWHGAYFYFDDSEIEVHANDNCLDCIIRQQAIFELESSYKAINMTEFFKSYITEHGKLNGGYKESDNTTKIEGWDLPYDVLVQIGDSTRKVCIRDGVGGTHQNADGGDDQYELLLIHSDGTIDTSTPLTYDYTNISWATAYRIDDKPVTIDGGGATINTIANRPSDNVYNAFSRNIAVYRSNVTVKNFKHIVTEEQLYRAPYAGIIYVNRCNNITFADIDLQTHKGRNHEGVQQGTYEIGGYSANDIKYFNIHSTNFFAEGLEDDFIPSYDTPQVKGDVSRRGMMGSNYCRNFYFKDCFLGTFDSHKGMGNLTMENCTFAAAAIMGSGLVKIIDSTFYIDGRNTLLTMRQDYGASFRGDIVLENVELKYSKDYTAGNSSAKLMILKTGFEDKDYDSEFSHYDGNGRPVYVGGAGCTNYMPVSMTLKNVKLTKYQTVRFYVDENGRNAIEEKALTCNDEVYLFDRTVMETYANVDISKFKDEGGASNLNRYIPPMAITLIDCDGINLTLPSGPAFKNTVVTIDGEVVEYPFNDE